MTEPSARRRARHDSRLLIVALAAPIVLTAVALGIVLAWLPQLPPVVAVHWGLHGPDGFADRSLLPTLVAVLGFGLPLLLGGLAVGSAGPRFGLGQKVLAVLSLATSALLAVLFLITTAGQRGLSDPRDAPGALAAVLIAFVAAIVAGVLAWLVLPRWSRATPEWRAADPLPLAVDERAVWLGAARFPIWALAVILVPTLAIAAITSWSAAREGGASWLLLLVPVIVVAALLSSTDWRVRVDASGLRVRSILGVPRWTVPVADIAQAGTTEVRAVGDFGGWGVRWAGARRVGVITRSGTALEVRRHDGSSLVVTVEDAATAAALLTARMATSSSASE